MLLKFLLVFSFVFCGNSIVLYLNDECVSSLTGGEGQCVEPLDCEVFRTHRSSMNICSFNKKLVIVCCPKSSVKLDKVRRRKSAIKCDEYKAQAKEVGFGVVGGEKAKLDEFPHMSAIGIRANNDITWQCGGSLISEDFIVTAAHCAKPNIRMDNLVVRIGDLNLKRDDDGATPQEFGVKRIVVHPDYKNGIRYHDLALMQLNRKAVFNKSVLPACLYQFPSVNRTSARVIGWGATSFGGPTSDDLIKGDLDLFSDADCNESYSEDTDELPSGIISSQICAGDAKRKKDTCQGDSGGPIQLDETHFENSMRKIYFEIIGVTSFGKFCASGAPGVYSRIYSYLDWIESVVF